MDALAASLQTAADWITVHITMWVLIATGLFLTVITRGVQVRHLPDMVRQVGGSRSGAEGGISSFQAFAISLAARVGVGNVFGVAAALLMGGPGAVFWMWVVAGVGMATAFVILIAGPQTWTAEGAGPATLTTLAISHELGGWTVLPMAVLIFVLAYSSIIAAYVYSDVNMEYLVGPRRWASWTVRVLSVVSASAGAILTLDVVWNAVDIAMAVMTLTNLVALLWLIRWGTGALRDYEAQIRAGVAEPVFVGRANPHLPGDVPGDVWASPDDAAPHNPRTTQPAASTGAEHCS